MTKKSTTRYQKALQELSAVVATETNISLRQFLSDILAAFPPALTAEKKRGKRDTN